MINLSDPLAVLAKRLPCEGHILSAVLEQSANLMPDHAVKVDEVIVDLGFRGVDSDNPDVEIIHRGKYKSLISQQNRWLRRRQAVEPAIGHLKSDDRMDRCWLQGALGDALHTIGCAAGYNLRWLLRAITRMRRGPAFLRLIRAAASLPSASKGVERGGARLVARILALEISRRLGVALAHDVRPIPTAGVEKQLCMFDFIGAFRQPSVGATSRAS